MTKFYFYERLINARVEAFHTDPLNCEFDIAKGRYLEAKETIKELFGEMVDVELQTVGKKLCATVRNNKTKQIAYKIYLD